MFSNIVAQKPYDTKNQVHHKHIRSLQSLVNSDIASVPLIRLGSNDKYVMQFDDFLEEDKEYYYRIIHCDMNWEETDILDVVYLRGFHDEPLDNWQFSNGTFANYTHYFLQLPNNDTDFAISGNYLVLVYELDEEEEVLPVITQRLLVAETKASPRFNNRFPTDVSNLRFKQQMDIKVAIGGAPTNNPLREIYLSVLQNGDYNKSIPPLQARNINKGVLQFDPMGTYSFWGHTEFRNFDIRPLNSAGRGVRNINQLKGKYEVILDQDVRRDQEVYLLDFDFNGRYYVDNFESIRSYAQVQNVSFGSADSLRSGFRYRDAFPFGQFAMSNKDLVTDYATVAFTLKSRPVEGDVYIYGGLTNWEAKPEFKMTYDDDLQSYVCDAYLKQAYYDYTYVIKKGNELDFTTLEGSWAETENDYLLLVYARPFGSRYDRLVGFKEGSSNDQRN